MSAFVDDEPTVVCSDAALWDYSEVMRTKNLVNTRNGRILDEECGEDSWIDTASHGESIDSQIHTGGSLPSDYHARFQHTREPSG